MVKSKKANKLDGAKINVPQTLQLTSVVPEGFFCYVDRAKWVLRDRVDDIKAHYRWQAPTGALLSLFLATSTSSFKETLGIKADVWEALAYVLGLLLLICSLCFGFQALKKRHVSADTIVENLRVDDKK